MRHSLATTLIVLLGTALIGTSVVARIADTFSMQGTLTDTSGDPVADGTYSLVFTIWDAPTGGTQKWSETQSVSILNGIFSAYLGSVNPIDEDVFFINIGIGELPYLEIKVESDPPLSPRMLIGGSPLAFTASRIRGDLLRTETSEVTIGKEGQDALVVIAQPAPEVASMQFQIGSGQDIPIEMIADNSGGTMRVGSTTPNQLPYIEQNASSLGTGMTFFQEVTGLGEPVIELLSDASGGARGELLRLPHQRLRRGVGAGPVHFVPSSHEALLTHRPMAG